MSTTSNNNGLKHPIGETDTLEIKPMNNDYEKDKKQSIEEHENNTHIVNKDQDYNKEQILTNENEIQKVAYHDKLNITSQKMAYHDKLNMILSPYKKTVTDVTSDISKLILTLLQGKPQNYTNEFINGILKTNAVLADNNDIYSVCKNLLYMLDLSDKIMNEILVIIEKEHKNKEKLQGSLPTNTLKTRTKNTSNRREYKTNEPKNEDIYPNFDKDYRIHEYISEALQRFDSFIINVISMNMKGLVSKLYKKKSSDTSQDEKYLNRLFSIIHTYSTTMSFRSIPKPDIISNIYTKNKTKDDNIHDTPTNIEEYLFKDHLNNIQRTLTFVQESTIPSLQYLLKEIHNNNNKNIN